MDMSTDRTDRTIEAARQLDGGPESWSDAAKDKAFELGERAQQRARELSSAAESYIRREPTKALIGAAALGGLLGILFKRR